MLQALWNSRLNLLISSQDWNSESTMKSQLVLASAAGLVGPATATNVDLPLPPMGFNNWARYTTHINQSIFTDAATAMASNGMLKAGYNRLNLDDAWSTLERASNGSMVVDAVKFPKGLIDTIGQVLATVNFIAGYFEYPLTNSTFMANLQFQQDYLEFSPSMQPKAHFRTSGNAVGMNAAFVASSPKTSAR